MINSPFVIGKPIVKERLLKNTEILPANQALQLPGMNVISTWGGGPFDTRIHHEKIAYPRTSPRNRKAVNCTHINDLYNYPFAGVIETLNDSRVNPTILGRYTYYMGDAQAAHGQIVNEAREQWEWASARNLLLDNYGQSIISEAYPKMVPNLTEISLPNFLAEARQLKSLIQLWRRSLNLVKNVANLHLNISFGWKPTIGDIGGMLNVITGVYDKIRAWNRSIGKLVSKRLVITSESLSAGGQSFYVNDKHLIVWSATGKKTLTAFIKYRPLPIKAMTDAERTLRAHLQGLGVKLNPRIIWDAIPFTFLIDWVFSIGDWLESFSGQTLELPISLEDSFLQYKEVLFATSQLTMFKFNETIYGEIVCPTFYSSENYFQRKVVYPTSQSLFDMGWKSPKARQLLLLLSLGLSRTR
jgi:hypothetical protein